MPVASIFKEGEKYGRLTLTGKSYRKLYGGWERVFVECICSCTGKTIFKPLQNLKSGAVISCGCAKTERLKAAAKHGMARDGQIHKIYTTWISIRQRCCNPKTIGAHNYINRGITVCDEWLNSFENFYKWSMDNGWKKGLSIDRVDNNGNYEPSNCRWTTYPVQSRNKRTNNWITAFGETKCFKDWVKDPRCKVAHATLFYRLKTIKLNPEKAISTPPQKTNYFLNTT